MTCHYTLNGNSQCTTSTLAMGVNLPAHLVVIKGTRRVRNSRQKRKNSLTDAALCLPPGLQAHMGLF